MSSKELIEFLDSIGARYYTDNNIKVEQVYVYEKEAYDKRKEHPEEYKDIYVSYLRVSNFDGPIYTRRDGICGYMPDDVIKEICIDLTIGGES